MRSFNKTLTERRADAAAAKQAMLQKLKERPGPDDPAVIARAAERKAIAEARDARMQARAAAAEQARIEEAARLAEEERQRVIAAQEAEEERLLMVAADEEAKKRARDARYAARKAAKKR
jgi:hypothetical protein